MPAAPGNAFPATHPDLRSTQLDHSAVAASQRLAASGRPFAAYSQNFRKHIDSAFSMVSYAAPSTFADSVLGIIHSERSELAATYDIHVSILERLVDLVPQHLLDTFVFRALRAS